MGTYSSKRKIRTARRIVRKADDVLNDILIVVLLLLLLFGSYSLWDSKQVYNSAKSNQYDIYKPTEEDSVSFEELCQMNPDVLGWLTVYGTAIDYPLTQGEDNSKYLNTSAEGEYSMAGAIFLDAGCSRDFSDYNTLIHGHHMAASAMFGDLSKFSKQSFFDSHKYGQLYANGRSYGIVFFSFSLVDAYNSSAYRTGISQEQQADYLNTLVEEAMYVREAGQEQAEHLVILSTCSSDITNGRYLLAGYLTDELYPNDFESEVGTDGSRSTQTEIIPEAMKKIPLLGWLLLLLIILIIVYLYVEKVWKKEKLRREEAQQTCEKGGTDKHDLSK